MATRFFLTDVAASYTPATIRGAWDATGSAVTKALEVVSGEYETLQSLTIAETDAGGDYDVLMYRGISGPLAAQTISGTVNVMIAVAELTTSLNAHWHLHIYVTQGDSDTVRGTLLTDYTEAAGTNEWLTDARGTDLNAAASLSSVAVSAGDRIVVEIGFVARNTDATSMSARMYYGRVDPPLVHGGQETTGTGYVEFSGDLTWDTDSVKVTQLGAEYADVDQKAVRVTQLGSEYSFSSRGGSGAMFTDRFDDYPDDDPFDKWTASPVPDNCVISASYGKTGKGLRLIGTSISKALTPADNVCEFSAWVYLNDDYFAWLLQVYANNNPSTAQTCVAIATDGTVNVYSWPGVTLLDSSAAGVFPRRTWTCFYYRTTVNDTGGTYEVRVNGVTVVSGSGDTAHYGGTSWDGVRVGANSDIWVDDVWVGDGTRTWLGCDWASVALRISQLGIEYALPPPILVNVTQLGIEIGTPYIEEVFEPGQSFGPLVWVEVLGPDGTTRAYAPVTLADPSTYYHGYKSPELLGVGRVARALSDEQGQYESQRFATTLDDVSRQWRSWLGEAATRLILNKRVVLRMISEPAWRAKLRPRTVAIGLIRDYRLE